MITPEPKGERHQGGAPYTFTEEDWNDYSPGVVEKQGKDAPGGDKYRASKVSQRVVEAGVSEGGFGG